MKALVTGGGGFLGGAIVRGLKQRGHEVRSFSRSQYPQLTALGVEQRCGDLGDQTAMNGAAEGCDIVFHVAAKAGIWGPYEEYYHANVTGTENVIAACQKQQIKRLVYTSSPSVVFNGQDMEGVDESAPYPKHYETHYPNTKAQAEQLVLLANNNSFATTALRPHLIWGPGDNHLIPRLIARAKAGQLRRVGDRPNRVDSIYIDNAAEAHLLAAEKLAPGSANAGKAYFISQGEPVPLWDLINRILAAANLPPVEKTISSRTAYIVGCVMETVYNALRLRGEPRMTRFLARELSTAHWFDINAANRDFGYVPNVSITEGLERLKKSFQQNGLPKAAH